MMAIGISRVMAVLAALLFATGASAEPSGRFDVYLDRSYYTNEPAARVLISGGGEQQRLPTTCATACIQADSGTALVFAETTVAGDEAELTLPLEQVPIGESRVVIELRDSQTHVLEKRVLSLRKHAPVSENCAEVKIDQENRVLLVDGKPFFPVGIWTGQLSDDWLGLYKELGFNTLFLWQGAGQDRSVSQGLEQLDRLHERGLWAIPRPLTYVKSYGGLRRNEGLLKGVEEMRDELQALKSHPAVLLYYGLDEAPERGMDEALQAFLETREVDPYHPVYISGSTPSRLDRYDFADILGRHSYWCPMGAAPPNAESPGTGMQMDLRERHRASSQALLLYPAGRDHLPLSARVDAGGASCDRLSRVDSWAKSLLYFRAPILHRATAESMRELSKEVHALRRRCSGDACRKRSSLRRHLRIEWRAHPRTSTICQSSRHCWPTGRRVGRCCLPPTPTARPSR